ncbi:lysoplasmalogenase [Aquimarina sp. 2201CG1-2-11]|uniref:lysoplasmalogenase n=1 Tax=Aquimarina discodermiae TaxID=3231043 RepID=UPI003461801D
MSNNEKYHSFVPFILIYAALVICDLIIGSNPRLIEYRYFTKPAILSALIIFFLVRKNKVRSSVFWITTLALLFSLFGDILLLFVEKSQVFFIRGLVMFLLAHLMYILVFLKKQNKQKKGVLFFLLSSLYGGILFGVLYLGLGDMMIPVIIYMIVILIMANTAYLRDGCVPKISFKLVFIGALLFMISDSLLAYSLFYSTLFLENVWIMSTYAFAQLLIVLGILKQENQTRIIG